MYEEQTVYEFVKSSDNPNAVCGYNGCTKKTSHKHTERVLVHKKGDTYEKLTRVYDDPEPCAHGLETAGNHKWWE